MNKKAKYIVGAASLLLILCVGGNIYAKQSGVSLMESWGKILNKSYKDTQARNNMQVYAEGENGIVLVSDIEQAKEFYMLSGMNEKEAEKEAVDYAYKREALYQAAIASGYSVTDEEVRAYLEELKELAKTAGNKEEVDAAIKQFPSEEEYWDFEFTVYQKNLPIQNYVKDLEKTFMETAQYSEDGKGEDLQAAWIEQLESIKTQLSEKENFQVVP